MRGKSGQMRKEISGKAPVMSHNTRVRSSSSDRRMREPRSPECTCKALQSKSYKPQDARWYESMGQLHFTGYAWAFLDAQAPKGS
jgi:hypothetical protein